MTIIKNKKAISNGAKYYDDMYKNGYNEAFDYQQVLFKPGKVVQSRELNFLQSLIHDKIKSGFDLTYKNGSVIMGCDARLIPYESANYKIVIGDGVVYWDGSFFRFFEKESSIIDNNINTFDVYLVAKYEIINHNDDTKLFDPAILNKIGKSIDGADRLKITFDIGIVTPDTKDEFKNNPINNQSFKIASVVNDKITLTNRISLEGIKSGESKVLSGLKIHPNPMREIFSINEDNRNSYITQENEPEISTTFIEVEDGAALINGSEVISTESKVFAIDKRISDSEDNKFTDVEQKTAKFKNIVDVAGLWGDIAYGGFTIDHKTFLFDMLQPGNKVTLKMKVPLTRKNDEGEDTVEYKLFDVCDADISDVYELWYSKMKEEKESDVIIGGIPIIGGTDIGKITGIIDIDSDVVTGGVGKIGAGYIGAKKIGKKITPLKAIYDFDEPWYVELLTLIHIDLENPNKSKPNRYKYDNWKSIHFKVYLNNVYDMYGQKIKWLDGNTEQIELAFDSTKLNMVKRRTTIGSDGAFVINNDILKSGEYYSVDKIWKEPFPFSKNIDYNLDKDPNKDPNDWSSIPDSLIPFQFSLSADWNVKSGGGAVGRLVRGYAPNPFIMLSNWIHQYTSGSQDGPHSFFDIQFSFGEDKVIATNVPSLKSEHNNLGGSLKELSFKSMNVIDDKDKTVKDVKNIKCLGLTTNTSLQYSTNSDLLSLPFLKNPTNPFYGIVNQIGNDADEKLNKSLVFNVKMEIKDHKTES